jgi:hypothetical protein
METLITAIRRIEHSLKLPVGLVCGYETLALSTGAFPTVSALCARHRWLVPMVAGGLAVHLWAMPLEDNR